MKLFILLLFAALSISAVPRNRVDTEIEFNSVEAVPPFDQSLPTSARFTIVSRAAWGARPATGSDRLPTPVSHVVIHHTAGSTCSTRVQCSAIMRQIQIDHQNQGWFDIGYNFLVGGDGAVYEGVGWQTIGAHTQSLNSRSIGIAFIGTHTSSLPTLAARQAAMELIIRGTLLRFISSNYRLIGHRQHSATLCPGTALYQEIQRWPNWSSVV